MTHDLRIQVNNASARRKLVSKKSLVNQ